VCTLIFSLHSKIKHTAQDAKPSFFFSPLVECGLKNLNNVEAHGSHGISTIISTFSSKNFSSQLIGAGLGASDSNSFTIASDKLFPDVSSDYMISVLTQNADPYQQTINEAVDRPHATITLNPEQTEQGISLSLQHDLNIPFDDCFYRLEVSVVKQHRNLKAVFSDDRITRRSDSDIISIKDFLEGTEQSISDKLTHLKFPQKKLTETGIDSIKFTLGKHLIKKNYYTVSVFATAKLPCGPETNLEYLFAPKIGSRHLELALGWDAYLQLAETTNAKWGISNTAYAGYSFSAEEKRIPVLKDLRWNHYYQSLNDQTPSYHTFKPAINQMPEKLTVNKGMLLQNSFMIAYQHKTTQINIGCSAGYQEAESNTLSVPWKNDKTAIVNKYLNPFNLTGASNNPSDPVFRVSGKMYPRTSGLQPETSGSATFKSGDTTLTPSITGALAQNASKKIINNADFELNHPTIFSYQLFASFGQKIALSDEQNILLTFGGQLSFGVPSELVLRAYQMWFSVGCNF
jgi:hypothetical protein